MTSKDTLDDSLTESQFLRVMPEVNPSRLMVVYPPCDVDAIKIGVKPISRKERQFNNRRYTFLSISRFWPEKKLDIIVKAAGNHLFSTFDIITAA